MSQRVIFLEIKDRSILICKERKKVYKGGVKGKT